MPSTTPRAGSSGVEGTLSTVIRPDSSSTRIRSVNVPADVDADPLHLLLRLAFTKSSQSRPSRHSGSHTHEFPRYAETRVVERGGPGAPAVSPSQASRSDPGQGQARSRGRRAPSGRVAVQVGARDLATPSSASSRTFARHFSPGRRSRSRRRARPSGRRCARRRVEVALVVVVVVARGRRAGSSRSGMPCSGLRFIVSAMWFAQAAGAQRH